MRSRKDDFDPLANLANVKHDSLDPLADMMGFARDLLAAGKNGLRFSQAHGGGAAFESLHRAMHQVPLHGDVFVEGGVTLRLANFLNHHLLGALSRDPTEQLGVDHLLSFLGVDLAGIAVDADLDVFLLAVLLFRRELHGGFDAFKNDLLGNVLFPVHQIHDPQQIGAVHGWSFS